MESLIIPNELFFSHILEEINLKNTVKIPVKGNSMLPFIVGNRDFVTLTKATKDTLQKGRIVVARFNENNFYLHRIYRIDGDIVTLRGDGNPYSKETCPSSAVLAEAIELERNGKTYTPNSLIWKTILHFWPSNGFARRVLLAIYRRLWRKNISL